MKKKILLVDDEKDFLKITKLNLERTGKYEVLCLSNANDIISQLEIFKPDVVILDMRLPTVGGKEACGMLNDDPIGNKIPVIVVSSWADDKNTLKSYKNVVCHIPKPVEIETLIAKVEKFSVSKREV